MTQINAVACKPPLGNAELANISRSIGNYASDHEEAFGDLDEVIEQDLEWLAYPYFVRGAVNVIEGNPGDGKSTFVVALAAAVSSGSSFKFFGGLASGRVLVLSAEDDPARVLKPRFTVYDANLSRIRVPDKAVYPGWQWSLVTSRRAALLPTLPGDYRSFDSLHGCWH
jgi:hypothetical protein